MLRRLASLILLVGVTSTESMGQIWIEGIVRLERPCRLLEDVQTGRTYDLFDGGIDRYTCDFRAVVWGYPRDEMTPCSTGIPFEVIRYERRLDTEWQPQNCLVAPEHPTTTDDVTITLAGVWSDGCTPRYPIAVVGYDTVYVDVSRPIGGVCTQAFTPWSASVNVGRLSAGDYAIAAAIHNFDGWRSITSVNACTFSVFGQTPFPSIWAYRDDFRTYRVVSATSDSSPIHAIPPTVQHSHSLLAYDADHNAPRLDFYAGSVTGSPPHMSYATVPPGAMVIGGTVAVDLGGTGTLKVLGSRDGIAWTVLGSRIAAGQPSTFNLVIPADQPANFLRFEGELPLASPVPLTLDGFEFRLGYRWVGDSDFDNDVSLLDYFVFEDCLGGPTDEAIGHCGTMDADGDTDVDVRDYQTFQANFGIH